MFLPSHGLLFSSILIICLRITTTVPFPLLNNLKAPLVAELDTSKLTNYIDDVVANMVSNVTQEMAQKLDATVDKRVNNALKEIYTKLEGINEMLRTDLPKECNDLQIIRDGVYTIYPADKSHPVQAYCVIEDNKKWTVIQRRDQKKNRIVDFYKTWNEYKDGFGDANGEHWLGNAYIHLISTNGRHRIRIKLEDLSGKKAYADYSSFSVGNEASKYVLHITGYSGTAGDSMDNVAIQGKANGQRFSTKDQDNDAGSRDCANMKHGGWWYSDCEYSDINAKGDVYPPRWLYNFGEIDKSLMMITKSNF